MLANALASIDSLETFPGRFPVIDEPLLASHQLHFVPVQNYLLFYRIDSSTQTVHILRFLYGHSDWQAILRADVLPT
jgi:toxin ParE1/3/4